MTRQNETNWIPNIDIGQDYDQKYADATIHYDDLNNLAQFFGRDMPVHRHAQYLQIHYIDSGTIHFHIDEKIYRTEGPGCFLTPPSVPHSFFIDKEARGHVLTVHQSLLWRLMKDGLQQHMDCRHISGFCVEKSGLDESQQRHWSLIEQTIKNIGIEWQENNLGKSLVLESLVRLLVLEMLRVANQPSNTTAVNNDDIRLFHRFSDLIEEHYKEHWLLPKYTDAIGVSESRLNQICQRIANRSPKKLINDRVLQEVKRLLVFTPLSINDICYQMGFRDPAYFSRFFKKQVGETAMAYRKAHN